MSQFVLYCPTARDVDFRWAALQEEPVAAARYVAARWIVLIRQTVQPLNLQLQFGGSP
ncbi:hypothetical protein [Paenibacillus pinihumi]|uniref:hypothetical protein n=1 Tax=Paenibacillus pinihumi TaxID=669462 RepID=UPI00040BE130|nr:hypothetical protein [Paenibacillus pinihumi]